MGSTVSILAQNISPTETPETWGKTIFSLNFSAEIIAHYLLAFNTAGILVRAFHKFSNT